MSAESISLISTISFAASGICFVLAVIFFVKFKIPNVIGDLTGKNARKSIEQMRQFNEKSGKKNYKPSKINEARGKLTEKMETESVEQPETGVLEENRASFEEVPETTALFDGAETEILVEDEMDTTLLNDDVDTPVKGRMVPITLINEVMLVHTNEEI